MTQASSGRIRLLKTVALIAVVPVLLLAVMIWRGQSDPRPCSHRFPSGQGGDSVLLSAWSESAARLRADSESAPGNQWLRGAALEPPPDASWHQVVQASRDLTYVRCGVDPDERAAFLWFSEFERDQIQAWLTDPQDSASQRPWRFQPGIGHDDPSSAQRLQLTRASLQAMATAAPDLLPDWLDAGVLHEPLIIGWLDGGVLLHTADPNYVLLFNRAGGIAGASPP
jgi:hypothetical protein